MTEKRIRVFSGVQPTGNIHIGNYLGALKQFVSLQDEGDCVYCIVDLHAITLPKDPEELRANILDVAALYAAVGIDMKKSIVFVQSDVPGHAELSWILTCCSYTGELSRMTQFKDKSREGDSAPTGLFVYPALMAADILLYDTDVVPVGNDQKQHIELTRDLAIRINNRFGEDTFVVPEGRFLKEGARVMALDDPTSKMSKSAESEMSRISVLDDDAKIKKAIMRSTTDSDGEIRYDMENKPGVSNLLSIYSAFSGKSIASLEKEYAGQGYGTLKKDLVGVTVDALRPIRERYAEIRYSAELKAALKDGAQRAGAIAEKTMERIRERFGIGT
ncbi:MAG: tryptophan--tRNA ligase [Clostridiales bacterium]|nr:tryptophan--tRNA ligase [Clostridiales bacterium]